MKIQSPRRQQHGLTGSEPVSVRIGVCANHDDPGIWIEFDPDDVMDMARVEDAGCNMIILTLERGSESIPFWEDYAEFFDAHVGMCESTDFLAAIQLLKAIKEQRFHDMRVLASGFVQFGASSGHGHHLTNN